MSAGTAARVVLIALLKPSRSGSVLKCSVSDQGVAIPLLFELGLVTLLLRCSFKAERPEKGKLFPQRPVVDRQIEKGY